MLEIQKLSLAYTEVPVLKSLSFTLNKGERIVLVGESGCGKTSLLKSIAGYLQPNKGMIIFDGENVQGPKDQLVPGHKKIKLVNQDFELENFHTVEENIGLRLLQFDHEYKKERTSELLKLTGLSEIKNFKAHQLSGGQKQRLAIARALADEPELLLLDEPFNQLDYFLKQKIESYIDTYLAAHNISLILVSHNAEETMFWGDTVLYLAKGKIQRKDKAENFYKAPNNRREAGFFGELNTVLINRKKYDFRPHEFQLKRVNDNQIKLSLKLLKIVNRGWFYDHIYKVGKQTIHLYHKNEMIGLNEIFITPLFN